MSNKYFSLLLCLFFSIGTVFAQTRRVSGVVSDATTGEPIVGAAVQLKGNSTTYSLTDELGNYQITVPSDGVLTISCLGFRDVEMPVSGRAVINIAMNPDTQTLEDVIVVAYGTVRREANTGSVSSVKNEQLASAPVTSVDKMLSGKMAGVSISSGSGQPGSTSTIRVRGTSSINAGNEPLWVVDGIPVMAEDFRALSSTGVGGGSSTTFINPNDIESITVLKDAAAASVYGSRAANGVILVTTKSGKSGQARFTVRAKYGAQQLINDRNIRPLTGTELLDYMRLAAVNAGRNPDDPSSDFYYPYSLLQNGTVNWYKELTRMGSLQEYEVNATGGNDKATYYSSLAYHKNNGVFYGADFSRFTARVNADYKLTKRLTTGTRINLMYDESNSPEMGGLYYSNPQFAMFMIRPWTPLYDKNGKYNVDIPENSNTNPRAHAAYNDEHDTDYRLNGSMFLEWRPISQLTFKTTNGVEYVTGYGRRYWSPDAAPGESATLQTQWTKDIRYTSSNTVSFDDTYGDHTVHALIGQEAFIDTFDYFFGYSPDVDPKIPYPTTSTSDKDEIGYDFNERTLLSFFGIANYNYANKYFLSASIRNDGSSVFGEAKRWGLFGSVGASWNIYRENFMKGTTQWLSALKLRASYGVNGNDNIATYRAYGVYSSVTYNGFVGMSPSRPANPNLSWEKNNTYNVGLDFGFFDDRLTGSIDYYNRLTRDMLLSKQVPYPTGFASNFMNIGSIRNRGLELQMEGTLLRNQDWNWTVGFNIAFNRSKVLDIGDSEFLVTEDSRHGGSAVRIAKDRSLYTFYLRDWYGVNPSNGDGLWWTEDGKLTNQRGKARFIYVGSPEPKATGGFNTSLSWKGFNLSAYFDFVAGNKVLTTNFFVRDGVSMTNNTSTLALNYWTKPGDTGVSPKVVAENPGAYYVGYSTRFLQDGSYTRIKDVTLSYTFPEKLLSGTKVIKAARVYVSALNPYTFHHLNALDPEVGNLGQVGAGVHSMVKSVIGGVEISF